MMFDLPPASMCGIIEAGLVFKKENEMDELRLELEAITENLGQVDDLDFVLDVLDLVERLEAALHKRAAELMDEQQGKDDLPF